MRYRINTPTVLHQSIDGEAVMINLLSGNYYSLNPSATVIWNLIAELNPTRPALLDAAGSRFPDAPATLQGDLTVWLEELEREDLLVPVSGPDAKDMPDPPSHQEEAGASVAYAPPKLETFTDMQEFLLVDPIHEVGDSGWPSTNTGSPEAGPSADTRP